MKTKREKRIVRKKRIRAKIVGTASCPRLSLFRSNRFTYAQAINDEDGRTLFFASDRMFQKKEKSRITRAEILGKNLAEKAREAQVSHMVCDRSGYAYHGIVKAVMEGARRAGLKI